MSPLNPRTDFCDDGGTRAWRANRATWNTIQPPPRGLRQRWRRLTFIQQITLILGRASDHKTYYAVVCPLFALPTAPCRGQKSSPRERHVGDLTPRSRQFFLA
jgi:hypothetical protein